MERHGHVPTGCIQTPEQPPKLRLFTQLDWQLSKKVRSLFLLFYTIKAIFFLGGGELDE